MDWKLLLIFFSSPVCVRLSKQALGVTAQIEELSGQVSLFFLSLRHTSKFNEKCLRIHQHEFPPHALIAEFSCTGLMQPLTSAPEHPDTINGPKAELKDNGPSEKELCRWY